MEMTKNYKLKDLKSFASDEWMVNETKKYRTVYDRMEITYIRVEFSFYNKLFDEKDWAAKIILKAFSIVDLKLTELFSNDSSFTEKQAEMF